VADPTRTEHVFELFDAAGGRGDDRAFRRFAASREGQALLRERPSLRDALSDADALASLPAGSLGAAYLEFARRRGFTPQGLLDANERGLGHLNARLDPHRLYFFERANVMHDLWHVLTGYDTDEGGEAALLAFSAAQGLSSRAVRLLVATAALVAPKTGGLAFQRGLLQAWRRGRRAAPLLHERWEALLARPLDAVRARLRIAPLAEAHPRGVPCGSLLRG
jgi:ubiquinone biosynthesis protein COQ4